jgi:hypothetical protein
MATQQNATPKSKSRPAETEAEKVEVFPVAETIGDAPRAEEAAPATTLAVAEPQAATDATAEEFDPALWQRKSFDLWAENVTAFFDFAERLAKAKTLDEVASLHARFVAERLESLARQSTELLTFAQRLANFSAAPLCGARPA